MQIHEVCQRTGLTKKAIYFYIEEGLVRPDRNKENNYLDFSEADVRTLQIIAQLRLWNFPISEVRELFSHPSMTNYYLHRQLESLRIQLLHQLGMIRSITDLMTELPPQFNLENFAELPRRSVQPGEADYSMLDLICPDQNARMISIFIWSSFLNVPKSEYRLFLWKKMTEQAQKELQGSLKYVARSIYALDSDQIIEDARQRYLDSRAIVQMDETTEDSLRSRILNQLENLADNTAEQEYWKLNYEKIMLPLVRFADGPLGDLMGEYNSEYLIYRKNMRHLTQRVADELLKGEQRPLYERLLAVLEGKLDLIHDAGLLGYYAFEMGLYRIHPLEKQRRILEEYM